MRTAYFGYRGVRILSVLILTVGKSVVIVVKECIFRIQCFFSDTAQMSLKFIIVYLGGLPVLTEFMATVKLGFKEECWQSFSSISSKLMECASCVACAEKRNDPPP